jgi:A nuclease family of the HNH/ENDO VII superfamily with conserved AHH
MFFGGTHHRLPFAAVNRRGDPGYREGWEKHHELPNQCTRDPALGPFIDSLGAFGFFIDDFKTNGILLPALPSISRASGLPLHVGGHAVYNARVMARMHEIRMACEMMPGDASRRRLAVRGLRFFQAELRQAIANQRGGTLDDLPIRGASDRDMDALIDILYSVQDVRRLLDPCPA